MDKHEIYDRHWNGVALRLRSDLADLFDRALAMYSRADRFDQIMQLVIDRNSRAWRDDSGFRICGASMVRQPIYLAIKDMARRRGEQDGFLRPGGSETKPNLDDYLTAAEKNN